MSTHPTSKPLTKPLKGDLPDSNTGVFDTLTAASLDVPGLLEDGVLLNVVIEDSVINNSIIGSFGPNSANFSDITVRGDLTLYNSNDIVSVYWDSASDVLNVNTDFVVTGCSFLGNLEICDNYIKATNLNGDVEIWSNGFGGIYLNGSVTNFASTGNFSTELRNGSFIVTASDSLEFHSTDEGSTQATLKSQNFTTLNGDIILTTETGIGSKTISNVKQTTGNLLVRTAVAHNLVTGDIVTFTGTDSVPSVNGVHTVGSILTSTTFLVSGTVTSQASNGSLLKTVSNDIVLDAGRYVSVPGTVIFGDTGNYISSNTTGMIISSNYIQIPQGDTINFGDSAGITSLTSGSLKVIGNTLFNDVILTLGDIPSFLGDNTDRGIEYYYIDDSGNRKLGWFGYKRGSNAFTFIPDATNTSEVISGAQGNASFNVLSAADVTLSGDLNLGCGNIVNIGSITGCTGDLTIRGTSNVNVSSNNILLSPGVAITVQDLKPLFFGTSGSIYSTPSSSGLALTSGSFSIHTRNVNLDFGAALNLGSTGTLIATSGGLVLNASGGTLTVHATTGISLSTGSVHIPTDSTLDFGGSGNWISGNTSGIEIGSTTEVLLESPFVRVPNVLTLSDSGTSNSLQVTTSGSLSIKGDNTNNLVLSNFTDIVVPDYTNLIFGTSGSVHNTTSGRLTLSSETVIITGGSTLVNTANVSFLDPILLVSSVETTTNDLKDRGIEYNHVKVGGTTGYLGWFGYKNSIDRFAFYSEAVNTSEVITGTLGNLEARGVSLNSEVLLTSDLGKVIVSSGSTVFNTDTYIQFGDTSNSVYSDGTVLTLNGLNGVVVNGDNYITGTLHAADVDIDEYILELGTTQKLDIVSVTNSSTTGTLTVRTSTAHFFVPGDSVTLSQNSLSGVYSVGSVIDSDEFTISHSDLTSPITVGQVESVLSYNHGKDVGIQINFWSTMNGTSATSGTVNYKTGFIGFQRSLERAVYYHDATVANNLVVAGNLGDFQINKLYTALISGFTLEGSLIGGSEIISGDNFDINGGSIDNTIIGGTTPSNGRFTSVTSGNTLLDGTVRYTPQRYTLSSGSPTGNPDASSTVTFISVSGVTLNTYGTMPSTGISDGQLKVLVCSAMGTGCNYILEFPSGTLTTPKPCVGDDPSKLTFKRAGQSIQLIWDATAGTWIPMSSGVYVS